MLGCMYNYNDVKNVGVFCLFNKLLHIYHILSKKLDNGINLHCKNSQRRYC